MPARVVQQATLIRLRLYIPSLLRMQLRGTRSILTVQASICAQPLPVSLCTSSPESVRPGRSGDLQGANCNRHQEVTYSTQEGRHNLVWPAAGYAAHTYLRLAGSERDPLQNRPGPGRSKHMPLYSQTKETAQMQHSPSAWLSFSCRSIEGLLFFPGSCRTVQGIGTFTMAKGLAARAIMA